MPRLSRLRRCCVSLLQVLDYFASDPRELPARRPAHRPAYRLTPRYSFVLRHSTKNLLDTFSRTRFRNLVALQADGLF